MNTNNFIKLTFSFIIATLLLIAGCNQPNTNEATVYVMVSKKCDNGYMMDTNCIESLTLTFTEADSLRACLDDERSKEKLYNRSPKLKWDKESFFASKSIKLQKNKEYAIFPSWSVTATGKYNYEYIYIESFTPTKNQTLTITPQEKINEEYNWPYKTHIKK